jgi:membrane protease YdiL (CAAX protease family)
VLTDTRGDLGLRLMPLDAALTLAVAWRFACRKYGHSWRAGWSYAPVRARLVALGALAGLACGLLVMLFTAGAEGTPMHHMVHALLSRPAGAVWLLGVAVVAAIAEETYYRGFIYTALADGWGRGRAVTVVTLWFAAVHAPQLGFHWFSIAAVTTISLIVTLLRAFTGSTWPGLATHLVYNLCLTAPAAADSIQRLLHR